MKNSIDALTRILPALVMACALAVIFAEPAAAKKAKDLKCKSCLTSRQIANGKIKGKDLKDSAVTGIKIAPNAIDSGKIADGSVGNADLAADSVTSDKVADGAVGNADLAADAVDSSKVAADSLTAGDLATDSVGASEIANDAVTAAEIAANAVTTSEIAADAVGASEIAPDAVGSSEVIGDSIPAADLSNEAGADFDGLNESENVTGADETVRSVSITAPAGGVAIVMASGTWDENGNPTTGRCSITTGVVVDTTAMQRSSLGNEADEDKTPFALNRGFTVGAGTTTFNLVCDVTGGNANIEDAQMTAMYFPTQY